MSDFTNANIKANNTFSYRNGIDTAGSLPKFAE